MLSQLNVKPTDFESVYGWLEDNRGPVQVWGVAENRRAALLAYSDGADDRFDWSNWLTSIFDDPSDVLDRFTTLEIEIDGDAALKLWSALPWAVTVIPATPSPPPLTN